MVVMVGVVVVVVDNELILVNTNNQTFIVAIVYKAEWCNKEQEQNPPQKLAYCKKIKLQLSRGGKGQGDSQGGA